MGIPPLLFKVKIYLQFWPLETAEASNHGFEASLSLIRRWATVDDLIADHAEVPDAVLKELIQVNVVALDHQTMRLMLPLLIIASYDGGAELTDHALHQLHTIANSPDVYKNLFEPLEWNQAISIIRFLESVGIPEGCSFEAFYGHEAMVCYRKYEWSVMCSIAEIDEEMCALDLFVKQGNHTFGNVPRYELLNKLQ